MPPKIEKKNEKSAKNDPQEEQEHFDGGMREPLSADHLSLKNLVGALFVLVPHAGGRTPAHCLRFAHPAEANWRPEAREFVVP